MSLIETSRNENLEIIVSGRELHEFLEVSSNYTTWMDRMISYGFTENVDYAVFWSDSKNGNVVQKLGSSQQMSAKGYQIGHSIKVDMAKEISMIQRTEKGKQARQYFIQVEKQYKQLAEQPNYHLPKNYKEALYMLAETVDENDQLKTKIEEDREKVVLANAITTSDEGLLIEGAAKYMRQNGVEIGRDRLFKWLRRQGYLVSRKGREYNIPTQKSLNQGLMKIHCQLYYDSEGELKTKRQVVVTGKGLLFFVNKFLHDGQLSMSLGV